MDWALWPIRAERAHVKGGLERLNLQTNHFQTSDFNHLRNEVMCSVYYKKIKVSLDFRCMKIYIIGDLQNKIRIDK